MTTGKKRYLRIVLAGVLLLCLPVHGENVDHENILKLRFGGTWIQDPYLSPSRYSGLHVGIGNEWWQDFRKESRLGRAGKLEHWHHVGRVDAQFGWTYNPVKSNVLYNIGLQAGWGAYYSWIFAPQGVQIMLGPYLDFDYMGRLHARNVNKPYSMDIATDIMAMAGVSYAFKGTKTSYRLRYLIRANLIGVDFMPDYWQSYYELTEGIPGRVRCSGMWNHRTLRHELTMDMQFPHSTWRVGIAHEYMEYGDKNSMFSREQVALIVGTCFRYRLNPKHNLTAF